MKTFQNQTARPKRLNEKLWHEMLRGNTLNQSRVLQHKRLRSPHRELALKQEVFDEGNCARRYWQLYFPAIGWSASRRDRKEDTAPDQMLNYGYAVLSALCHRGLVGDAQGQVRRESVEWETSLRFYSKGTGAYFGQTHPANQLSVGAALP